MLLNLLLAASIIGVIYEGSCIGIFKYFDFISEFEPTERNPKKIRKIDVINMFFKNAMILVEVGKHSELMHNIYRDEIVHNCVLWDEKEITAYELYEYFYDIKEEMENKLDEYENSLIHSK